MLKKILWILLTLSVAGCTRDPQNVTDLSRYSSGSFPATLDDLVSILGAGYANYRSEKLSGFQLLCKTFAASEHTSNLVYGGQQYWNEMEYNHLSTSNLLVTQTWQGLFEGVKDANVALERADFFEKNYMAPSEQQQVNYIRGEAYFLRAYYYFNLECFFGEAYITPTGGSDKKGLPIFTAVPTTLEQTQKPRSSAREVWDLIISDLKKSADLLQGVHWEERFKGRVTDWTAKGLLGKAYVFTQDWDKAKTVLKDVIENSGKSLMPFSKYRMAFNSNVGNNLNNNVNSEFNEESLFEINVDRVAADYGIFGGSPNKNLTTSMGLIWSPSGFNDQGTGSVGMGYANECVHDKNLLRFGFTLPLYSLIPNPDFDPTQPEDVSTGNIRNIPDTTYTTQTIAMRKNKIADPRLYVCALEPYQDTVYFALPGGSGKKRPVAKCANLPTDAYHGWSYKKYQTLDARLDDVKQADGANYYLLRLADIYLLYAEACMNSGDAGTALEYLNKVHRRAYDQPVNTPSPYDYASLTDRTKASAADVNLANNPLHYERFAELFAEGHWWFDVCRWRIGASEANYYGNLLPDNHPSQWNDVRSYAFPIPLEEINANPKLEGQQNPGY
ncbi:MAG: RagB/SusD family nutrient uptake outer membrane protein [Flavisolibacter sp.]